MERCPAMGPPTPCVPCLPPHGCSGHIRGVNAVADLLHFFFTPETTHSKHPRPEGERPAWQGALKALLWTGFSIAAGTALALMCH